MSCGIRNEEVPLELAHVIPLAHGGDNSKDNYILLCPNCHRAYDREPPEYEFVSFLAELLKHHPDYSDILPETLLGDKTRYRVDLITQRHNDNNIEKLLIECKTYRTLTAGNILSVVNQLKNYRDAIDHAKLILAVPATLKEKDYSTLSSSNIEIWDLNYIKKHFSNQIEKSKPSYYRTILLAQLSRSSKPTKEQEFINALSSCNPGRNDWHVYQSLVGDILEHLFSPQLSKPIPEASDKTRTNRRDFILPNYSETGFWSFMRDKYKADYVVVDSKNYTRKIKKSDVLQIANYLKVHGAGLFALILSRIGGDSAGCEHTLREQWLIHEKLILVLDDSDVIEMLTAKSDGRKPEDILSRKIEQFRLSM